jgi:hypothetical protein
VSQLNRAGVPPLTKEEVASVSVSHQKPASDDASEAHAVIRSNNMDEQVTKKQALQILTHLGSKADELYLSGSRTVILAWRQQARDLIARIFGPKSEFISQFDGITFDLTYSGLEATRMLIDTMIEVVKLWEEPEVAVHRLQNKYFSYTRPGVEGDFAFVLMPFKPEFFKIYDAVIKPAINQLGLQCFNAQEDKRPTRITDMIFSYIVSATLLIADLTSKNPNVFYELGLAHAMNKPVILLTQTREDVPFDVAGIRYMEYNVDHPDALKQELEETIKILLAEIRS